MMNIPFSDEQLVKYFSKEGSINDQMLIDDWVSLSVENLDMIEKVKQAWQGFSSADQITIPKGSPNWDAMESKHINKTSPLRYIAVAAAMAVCLFTYIIQLPNTLTTETGFQETQLVELSDGSKVHLNYKSKLEYVDFSDESERTVHLSGEAYFEIARDESKPFTVITNNSKTQVLGTKFNINSRNNLTTLVVTEGKVSFKNVAGAGEKILVRNESSKILTNGEPSDVISVKSKESIVWLQDRLIFKETKLEKVMEELSYFYTVEVTVDKSLKDVNVSIVVKYDKSFEDILAILEESLDIQYKEDDGSYFLYKKVKKKKIVKSKKKEKSN